MVKVTEEVTAKIVVRVTYDKKKGARENALRQIELFCNRFGSGPEFGGYEVKSIGKTEIEK